MAAKRCRVLFVCYLCASWSRDIKRALKGHKMPSGAQCSERGQLGAAVLGTLMWVHLKGKPPVQGPVDQGAMELVSAPPARGNSICSRQRGMGRVQEAPCVHTHPSPPAAQVLAQPCCPGKWLPQSQHPGKVAGMSTAVLGLRHSFIHPCGMATPFAVSQVPQEEQHLFYKARKQEIKGAFPLDGTPWTSGALISATPRCRRESWSMKQPCNTQLSLPGTARTAV